MAGLIYYIASKANGRVYVGSTTRSAKQRWAEHMHYLRKGTHHSKHLQRVYAKYGAEDLEFKSFREIERLTGRCRRVIARACKEAV